jgi:hypothetical protein
MEKKFGTLTWARPIWAVPGHCPHRPMAHLASASAHLPRQAVTTGPCLILYNNPLLRQSLTQLLLLTKPAQSPIDAAPLCHCWAPHQGVDGCHPCAPCVAVEQMCQSPRRVDGQSAPTSSSLPTFNRCEDLTGNSHVEGLRGRPEGGEQKPNNFFKNQPMSQNQNPGQHLCYKVMKALSNRRNMIPTKLQSQQKKNVINHTYG